MVLYVTVDKGPMFSGKSSSLVKRYNEYTKMKSPPRIGVFKHSVDTRYKLGDLSTHDGKNIPCMPITSLAEIEVDMYDVMIIDEAQFFDGLLDFVRRNFHLTGKILHVAGLNGDKNRNSFGDINMLSPLCSEEILHRSICAECGKAGTFSVSKKESNLLVDIGSDDKYFISCNEHL